MVVSVVVVWAVESADFERLLTFEYWTVDGLASFATELRCLMSPLTCLGALVGAQ